MDEQLLGGVLESTRFSSALASATAQGVFVDFPQLEPTGPLEAVDWDHALLCCSLLTQSTTEASQRAVLRITQACMMADETSADQRSAAAILLERLGNRPALELAEGRDLVEEDAWTSGHSGLALDVIRSRLDLSVPAGAAGASLAVNRFQRDFWTAASDNDWLSVSAPTSAGKSFIVRQWIEELLRRSAAAACVYLVPTRALIQEVSEDLRDHFPAEVGIYTLPWDSSIGESQKEIYVLTQERLHLLVERLPDFNPALVFVDEAQKLGDDARGVLLQQVLDRLVWRHPTTQIVFASPLSGNPELLLDSAPVNARAESFVSETVTVNQNLFWLNQVRGKPLQWLMEIVQDGDLASVGEVTLPARPSPNSKRLALAAVALGAESQSNVIYVNGAADAEKTARQVYDALGEERSVASDQRIADLVELSERTVHPSYALGQVLKRGVAFHYGNMPLLLRSEVERLFRDGALQYLVCTSTLLEGVNLPCKNLFVRGPRRGRGTPMAPADFWNLAGRAGRWGKEFQGNIVCIDTSDTQQWPSPPKERVRYPLVRASDAVIADVDTLLAFIEAGAPVGEGQGKPPLESVVSYLCSRQILGESISSVPGVAKMSPAKASALGEAISRSLTATEVPRNLLLRHAGISPFAIQRLIEEFRSYTDPADLAISAPESSDAVETMVSALGRLVKATGASFGTSPRQFMLAMLVVNWMRGAPLALIIRNRLDYLRRSSDSVNTATVIRGCMADVEQVARFEAPKYLACYVDVLRYHYELLGVQGLMDDMPDIAMLLELGVSRTTELSLMTLGLSRTAAIALQEFITEDEMSPAQAAEWLRQNSLDSLGLAALVEREIEAILQRL